MPRCMITFSHLSNVSLTGPFFIRVKWGRDGFWCQNPHVTQNTKKDAKGNHTWSETIVIQSKFDWKKDAIVMHVYESGFLTNAHVGDASIIFNQLVLGQATPVVLNMTQRLGTVLASGQLHVQVKALDFGHELVQFAPQPETFQPHYFVASSVPLGTASMGQQASAAAPNQAMTLGNGQQIYLQPMGGVAASATGGTGAPSLSTATPVTAMPTANGGFMFYAMPPAAPQASTSISSIGASYTMVPPAAPSEPAPPYPGLDVAHQYTADFTYDAPSAPTETLVPSYHHPSVVEQAPPPMASKSPSLYPDGDSLI